MNYLYLVSPEYLESMEDLYRENPEEVPLTWRFFFDGVEAGRSESTEVTSNGHDKHEAWDFEVRAIQWIEAYRRLGHFFAKIDPLEQTRKIPVAALDPKSFGLDQVPKGHVFQAAHLIGKNPCSLEQLTQYLKEIYTSTVGIEFSHITIDAERQWLYQKIEKPTSFNLEEKKEILKYLVQANHFEAFIHRAFTGQKRFSLEGGDSLIPGMQKFIKCSAKAGVQEIVIGMAHRGRLNVLGNVVKKPFEKIFTEFEGLYTYEGQEGGGDVKYHMGYSKDVDVDSKKVHLSLCFNPSHLETVNAVASGISRAKQERKYANDPKKLVPILIHGDAAVIGQGIVVEMMNMMNLKGYTVGGTIHVVINNQVGFTTGPSDGRTSFYCTDFAKGIESPIIHVNGEDPEAVLRCFELAAEYRQQFGKDFFIDLYCYRKYGHNEGDEPRFTQPQMYSKVGSLKSPADNYAKKIEGGEAVLQEYTKAYVSTLEEAHQKIKGQAQVIPLDWNQGNWKGFKSASETDMVTPTETGIKSEHIQTIIKTIHEIPQSITAVPKLQKMFEGRYAEIQKSGKVDWAVGEQLAYGSLLLEGYGVRLSGQDAQRGTFSHRHAVVADTAGSKPWTPLQTLTQPSRFHVWNSPLSEYSVMGFDYGYAWADPTTLTLWEGQFGDFGNGAQIILDQYLSSSESKWHRTSGLVLLLPHGFEGQGPEHSSARLERYLQLCAKGNMQVIYPTTPVQFCHALRRQLLRPFRKPLIVMTPKSPLRMPEVVSNIDEFTKGSFQNILVTGYEPQSAKRVLVCSGKVYWDLLKACAQNKMEKETAFVRIEQLYPLDKERLLKLKKQYAHVKEWTWVQEEPRNNGAWFLIKLNCLELDIPIRYVGRDESPSVATGSFKIHQAELEKFLHEAFNPSKN